MNTGLTHDVAVIGGGPAGLSAAFEGTITDLYLPKRRQPSAWRRTGQPGAGLAASSDRIQVMNSAIAANWHVAAAQTYAWKISW